MIPESTKSAADLEEERARQEIWRGRLRVDDVLAMSPEERRAFLREESRLYAESYDPEEWRDWQESALDSA